MQSKAKSFVEALVNTLIGYFITLVVSPFIYWLNNIEMNFLQMNGIVACFTIVSIARQYIIRRFFNNKIDNQK